MPATHPYIRLLLAAIALEEKEEIKRYKLDEQHTLKSLKAEGLAPEQMLVLVKAAMSIHGLLGFGAQALTSDIVRWSIDAYFDE